MFSPGDKVRYMIIYRKANGQIRSWYVLPGKDYTVKEYTTNHLTLEEDPCNNWWYAADFLLIKAAKRYVNKPESLKKRYV